jgi:hypothetical protein
MYKPFNNTVSRSFTQVTPALSKWFGFGLVVLLKQNESLYRFLK